MSNSKSNIVCLGSIMCDLMCYAPRLPKPGESLPGCSVVPGNGGKGANSAVAAARLGGNVSLIGKIGNDNIAQGILNSLKQMNINSEYVYQTSQETTGTAVIIVEKNGENRIIVASGANLLLTMEEVTQAENTIKNCKVFVCNFESNMEAAKMGLKIAHEHGVKTIVNAAPAVPNPDVEFYTLSTIFCVNETEALFNLQAEITTGMTAPETSYEEMVAALLKRGCKNVIVTRGENSILLATENNPNCVLISAPKVTAVDTTGAGDAFVGGLAYYIANHENLTLNEQIRRAAFYASDSVQRPGTQSSYAMKNELPSQLFD
uniref:Ribokinase n=1 Tax=Strigamia maritima TaxID=126957 RepID=T1J614_STRMM